MLGIPFLETVFRSIKPSLCDDMVDRMNYFLTSSIMIFFAILVSAKQYVGKPIQCWVPAQFKGGWEQYAEDYCFIKNTYFVPFSDDLPEQQHDRREAEIGYYQWVPIVMAIQALLFYLPHQIWKCLYWQSGVNVKSILKLAQSASIQDTEARTKTVDKMAHFVKDSFWVRARNITPIRAHIGSTYITVVYVFIKFLYVANVVGQLFLLNTFLGTQYTFWGAQIFSDLINGREWQDSGHFPRVTMCDFQVRVLGNVQRHSVQCVLMINLFTEKIYLFLWFWFLLIAAATILNACYWIFTTVFPFNRNTMVDRYLRITGGVDRHTHQDRITVSRFKAAALPSDTTLLLRFISSHAGEMVSMELTGALWRDYCKAMGNGCHVGSHQSSIDDVHMTYTDSSGANTMSTQPSPPKTFHLPSPGPLPAKVVAANKAADADSNNPLLELARNGALATAPSPQSQPQRNGPATPV